MKNALTMVALLATASLISACSGSGGGSSSESPSTPAAPAADDSNKAGVETAGTLIGSFRGTDALCSGGSVSESTKLYLVYTVYTFREDGTYNSETTREGKVVASVDGKYKLEGEVLTLESGVRTATGTYKIVGNELMIDYGNTDDGSCPVGEGLITKFVRVGSDQGVVPAPIPSQPDSEVSEPPRTPSKPPRGPSKVPKPQ